MADGQIIFFSPEMTRPDVCHHCKACINVCPPKAIEFKNAKLEIDRFKCAQYVLAKEECFACTAQCFYGAIRLVPYEIKNDMILKVEEK